MASFNRVILMGNVTRDPELRYLANGTALCDLGMAMNRRFKDKDGNWADETTFVTVTLWARTAEIAGEYLTKGSPVMIEGRLKLDQWEKDGKKNSRLTVVGETMQLLGTRGQGGGQGGGGGGGERSERPASRGPAPARGKPAPAKSNAPSNSPSDDYYQDYDGGDDGGQGGPQDDIPF